MYRKAAFLISLLLLFSGGFPGSPFSSKEGAVGYIVVEEGGKVKKYIVTTRKDGRIELIEVSIDPSTILKKEEGKR